MLKASVGNSHQKAWLIGHRAWADGQAAGKRGQWREAARAYKRAFEQCPSDTVFGLNLADALFKCGRLAESVDVTDRVLRQDTGNVLAIGIKANALHRARRFAELVALLSARPRTELSYEHLSMLGSAFLSLYRPADALEAFMAAIARRPAEGSAHYFLGRALSDLDLKREAAECFRTALLMGLGAFETGVRDLLALYERECCDWASSQKTLEAMQQGILDMAPDAALPMTAFVYATFMEDPALQRKAASVCANHFFSAVTPLPARVAVAKPRIKVGYVSADFHEHATSYLMAELLERHNRDRFEVFVYSHGPDEDSPMRRRIKAAPEHFVDVRDDQPKEIASRIRADEIDVLVDLKGFTKDARPEIFAYRAAPVQVSYLGYPGTTGADYIDYVMGDAWVTPLEAEGDYSEKIAQLPDCYQCNDGTRPLPVAPSRASQGLPEDALVLCGFNQPYKITPEVYDVWCRILSRVPDAVLWLLGWNDQAPLALQREAALRGIDKSRIIFAPKVSQAEHLNRIACADLFLDTWPCNGHTTASDMLWAGVPVLTFSGRTFASRVAGSLLQAVGVPELACQSVESYEAQAMELVTNASLRAGIAARIQAARHSSSLFDSQAIARDIEALYERMWERKLAGCEPAHLPAQIAAS